LPVGSRGFTSKEWIMKITFGVFKSELDKNANLGISRKNKDLNDLSKQ
jgi:hypothetical protein